MAVGWSSCQTMPNIYIKKPQVVTRNRKKAERLLLG